MNVSPAPSIPQTATSANVVVPLALTGTFVAGIGAHLLGPQTAAIADGLTATAGEVSWIATLYAITTFLAFSLSPLLARTFGLRRLFVASAAVFALAAFVASMSMQLPLVWLARAVQGFAGGMFGPLAFVAIFRAWAGPRVLLGFAMLAFVLVVSANLGPLLSTPIVHAFGWRGLFVVQGVLALALLFAGRRWLPMSVVNRDSKQNEWLQVSLLGVASGAWVLFALQGVRLFPVANVVIAIVASLAFLVVHLRSNVRVINGGKLLDRRFAVPITLNFVFRAVSAAAAFLLPHVLMQSHAGWWLLIAQIAAFPIAWRLMQRVDARVPMASGLVLLAMGLLLAGYAVSMPVGLVLVGIGQMLFLVSALMTGASSLKPEHGSTGTIVFNMSTAGGATLGFALISQLGVTAHGADLRDAFLALSALLLLAAPVTLVIGRKR